MMNALKGGCMLIGGNNAQSFVEYVKKRGSIICVFWVVQNLLADTRSLLTRKLGWLKKVKANELTSDILEMWCRGIDNSDSSLCMK